jgi:hypothetical protein
MTQTKVGWRPYVATTTTSASTLLTSLYSVWNGDTTTSTLDSSIYGAWNGENNVNDSVSTNHGTLMNGCTFTTGKLGQAFTFDGVNDYLELPSNTMNFTSDFTISFWAYMRTRDDNAIISNIGNDGINRGFYIDSDGSYALRFVANYLAPYYSLIKTDNSALFDMNVWNHYTFICKNGVGQWYKNGVANGASGTVMTNGYITNNKPIIGGYRSGNAGVVSYNKNMALDSITTWTKAISQDEITQLYNAGTGTQYPFSGQTLPSANNQFAIDNATLMNGCTFTDGKIGKAFTFDGINDYVALPNNSLNFTGDFTTSFWVYNDGMSINTWRTYIGCSFYSTGTYGFGWQFGRRGSDNNYYFYCFNGDAGPNSIFVSSNDLLPVNQWSNVVISRKWSTQTKIYINGVLANFSYSLGNAAINPGYQSTMTCTIGALKDSTATSAFRYIKGKMDSVNIWQKELTQAEVTELYNSGAGKQLTVATPIVTNGLVLNLDASRTSSYPNTGTTWYDISGNGYNGTMVNGPVFGTASSGVINFDGINDYVSVSNVSTLTNYTIESWFKINYSNSATYARIIEKGLNNEFTLCINKGYAPAANKYTFQLFDGSVAVQSTSNVDSRYNHICVSVERTSGTTNVCKMYVNGVLENTASISGSITSNTNPIYIGNNPGAINACGLLCEIPSIRMYNRTLSATEITQNFNATKSRFGL